jgi:hypothetical protein
LFLNKQHSFKYELAKEDIQNTPHPGKSKNFQLGSRQLAVGLPITPTAHFLLPTANLLPATGFRLLTTPSATKIIDANWAERYDPFRHFGL